VALATAQSTAGRRAAFILGPEEREWHSALAEAVPEALFPLQDARIAAEIALSPLFTLALGERLATAVANDSGAGHLLAASGCAMVSLFGPTAAAKFAPAARRLEVIHAQRFGSAEMTAIPLATVIEAVERSLDS